MDLILISVTALALAMAAGMAIVVATLLREERARSAARVAALSAMASDSTIAPVASPSARTPPVFVTPPSRVPSAAADDLVIRPVAVDESTLFAPAVRPSPWGPRLSVIGALAAVIVAAGAVMISGSRNSARTPSSVVAAPAADAPLELLSLSHSQQSDHIVISGLVQNPRNAAARAHIVATAFVFGPDGAFLSSSRAPLDFTTLTPGEESRFVVSVPVSTPVSRYRIGFRTEDGQVLPHVDKRAPDALAQK